MIELIVHGATGRMGTRICALAENDERVTVVARSSRHSSAESPGIQEKTPHADVVVDFSCDEGARRAVRLAEEADAALLVGTTALSQETIQRIDLAAEERAVMVAANTSRGVAAMHGMLGAAVRALGPAFEIDIIEHHHRGKRDAPSGTALRLQDTIEAAQGAPLPADRVHAVRAGDIVGEHTVQFAGPAERIRITHTAGSRDVFAAGAIDAAVFLAGCAPGRYAFEDVLKA